MRQLAATAFCLAALVAIDGAASDHQEGPALGIANSSLRTYTLGHYPGTLYVSLHDLAAAVGVAPQAFHVDGAHLMVPATMTKLAPAKSSLAVRRSGQISAAVVHHIGEIWVPATDILKALGATPAVPLRTFGRGQGAGQSVRLSIRGDCEACILKLR